MTDRELRRMSRSELIEILYQQKKIEEELRRELKEVSEKLESREMKIRKAGSIAEAAISIPGGMGRPEGAESAMPLHGFGISGEHDHRRP